MRACLCVCVLPRQASANAPAVQQCISLINSAALSIHSSSPTKKHKSLPLSFKIERSEVDRERKSNGEREGGELWRKKEK